MLLFAAFVFVLQSQNMRDPHASAIHSSTALWLNASPGFTHMTLSRMSWLLKRSHLAIVTPSPPLQRISRSTACFALQRGLPLVPNDGDVSLGATPERQIVNAAEVLAGD